MPPRNRKGAQAEESNYVKYLKFKQSGFQISTSDKEMVWIPAVDKQVSYVLGEVLSKNDKEFSVRSTETGEVRTSVFFFIRDFAF